MKQSTFDSQARVAYDAYVRHGENYTAAARELMISPMTCRGRVLRHLRNNPPAPKVVGFTEEQMVPRCGTCCQPADPFNSDEGYSHCCNDRIEYPEEWMYDGYFRHVLLGCPEPTYDD